MNNMGALSFTVTVQHKDEPGITWEEKYVKETRDAQRCAEDIVAHFNATLRPHEKEREVVSVVVHGSELPVEHKWTKLNWVTQSKGGRMFDTMKCERCGITGKRPGLGKVIRDSKFSPKVYIRCDTAVEHIGKKGKL